MAEEEIVRRDHEFGPDGKPKRWTRRTTHTLFDLSAVVFRGAAREAVCKHLNTGIWADLTPEELRRIRQVNALCEQMKYEALFTIDDQGHVSTGPDIEPLLREICREQPQ